MSKQISFNLFQGQRGGRRPNCGRKRIHSKGVAHRKREKVSTRTPMHINFKYRTYIKTKICLRLLKRAIFNSRKRGLRVIHYSLQTNHIHLIVEADNNRVLTKGMRSLTVTFAKGLRKGRVQLERYHLHVLKTLRETKHAVNYVLFNQQKHGKGTYGVIDEYSSVLSAYKGLQRIREFAQRARITLRIIKGEIWEGDRHRSYLLSRS